MASAPSRLARYSTVCSITPKIGRCLSSSAQIRTVSPFFRNGVTAAPPAIVSIVRMLSSTEDSVERLPRRQKLTTAVLPAVQRKSSETGS